MCKPKKERIHIMKPTKRYSPERDDPLFDSGYIITPIRRLDLIIKEKNKKKTNKRSPK